ncbi:YfcE family phosphodiesterase [Schleiferilactobacillus perolens]|jgi:putative phosphoesterase|uniref:YfcE family phosphodiesterase n=1 Tax=Schleiferilactobacillus perolens TaxID=100468 RepID=UPI0009F87DFB|nr:metallophosphoesterase [Schleiferilactobacillus perolens]MCI1891251.1 metallophosphoesterase [Schleiferilactobacillus harbinensis]MCI1911811.1 metallophosphoesterase [Schleiferilactobacillus harbinensis]MCI2171582.1 metallophosphoesterase [Schleiferilactobacillus perolens]
MRTLVVSDTHGDRAILETIYQQFQNEVDAFFYCGDSELAASDSIWQVMYAVRGNMDFDADFPMARVEHVKGVTVYETHGHRLGVSMGTGKLAERAHAVNADCAFYGHTHMLEAHMEQGMLILNPGSISQPRSYQEYGGTFAIVNVNATTAAVDFYDHQLQPIPALAESFTR